MTDAQSASAQGLALYQFEGCPYCTRVRFALDALGVDVEMRDTLADAEHGAELVAATGRRTVPVLRIDEPDGSTSWLSESAEIIRYLEQRFS